MAATAAAAGRRVVRIDIISDTICPYVALAKKNFRRSNGPRSCVAVAGGGAREQVVLCRTEEAGQGTQDVRPDQVPVRGKRRTPWPVIIAAGRGRASANPTIPLSVARLSIARLSIASLYRASLHRASLHRASLYRVSLSFVVVYR